MSGSERGALPVQLLGPAMRALVRAVALMSEADLGRWAVIGGVAVAARLGLAHRVTADVDTVVDQDRLPAAIAVLRALPSATADPAGGPHRLLLEGTKVEVIEVGQMPPGEDLDELTDRQRLFIAAHSWALDTASPVTIASTGPDAGTAVAPFATVAALVAMKLHAIQDRSGDSQAKRAGDAWDLHQLLTLHNRSGAVAAALREAPDALSAAVLLATDTVLVTGATRTRSWLRTSGGVQATVGAEEIRALGQQLLDGLR
jgi:predicted nucleotidyltransferase